MGQGDAVWYEELRVRSHEIDARGQLSVVALAGRLQEAAGGHATALGWAVDQLAERGLTWVLSRLRLVVGRLPAWREPLSVETWPAGIERLWALRQFCVRDGGGGEIGRAASGWLLLNLATRRPVRPPSEIEAIAAGTPGRVLGDRFDTLPEPARPEHTRRYEVRFSDLDMNQHANNVSVIGWLVDTLPHELLAAASLAELEVDFRAEARAGDAIHAEAAAGGAGAFLHRLRRDADGREIARARSVWRQ